MDSRVEKRQGSKKKKWLYWVIGILIGLVLIIGGYLYYIYDKVGDTVATMHDPLARDEDPDRQKELQAIFKDSKALNILLLGVDERPGDRGRSDTMIFMSLNPKTNSIAMLSIPRDTYVNIPGYGMDKINHAYAFGDVELSVQTVEDALDLPVHFYAKVNMEGFKQGIDALGGVTIQNDLAFSQGKHQFSKGQIHLNGTQALDYIRMRKSDPRGDLGRNERQRTVVTAAIDEAASLSSITKIGSMLEILGDNVKTDLNMDKMQTLFTGYRQTRSNIKTIEINGSGQMINSIWYYVVPDAEMDRVHAEMKAHMEAK